MKQTDCAECGRLREISASFYADYIAARDELALTSKHDPEYDSKRKSLNQLEGRLRESYRKADFHRTQHPAD